MKKQISLQALFTLLLTLGAMALFSQSSVWQTDIEKTTINVRGNPVVLGEVNVNLSQAGIVRVHFDGICISSVGDRIILAASNTPNWGVNDGSVSVEAISADNNTFGFSHTRVYPVAAGPHKFYAVSQNYVELEGDGKASVYGSLSVEFIPDNSSHILLHSNIQRTNLAVEGLPVSVAHITLNAPSAGKAIVQFDGTCMSSVGDLIVLAASNSTSWTPNDGNVSVEAYSEDYNRNSFAHTRVYDIAAGAHDFYALAHNYVETQGNGKASIYGTLTVTFVPQTAKHITAFSGVSRTNINLRGAPVVLAQNAINPTEPGKVLVQFNGHCYADVGDRIVLAASNGPNWSPGNGNVTVEAVDDDVDHFCFSHSRVYSVAPGSHNFYAVGQNYVEMAGDGIASVYGSLVVQFFPQSVSAVTEAAKASATLEVYPNPSSGQILVAVPDMPGELLVRVSDASGKAVLLFTNLRPLDGHLLIDIAALNPGMYFLTVTNLSATRTAQIVRE
jgi:hypothetical protein